MQTFRLLPTLLALCVMFCRAVEAFGEEVFVPHDAGLVNVRDFGAKGDGRTDDTAALRKAVRANLNAHKTLFFPAGTYLVSDTIAWAGEDGIYWPWLTWQGEGRGRTVLRLADGAPGFDDAENPKPLAKTGCYRGDGKGENAAHGCYFFDMTLNVGARNPGAVALDYNSHNTGAVVRLDITSEDGAGRAGLRLARDPGPCLIKDVTVRGFDRGIELASLLFSVTFERIQLEGQRVVGFENGGNVAAIRQLTSVNRVPALRNRGWAATTVLLDSSLTGGAADAAAIEHSDAPTLVLRNVTTGGYGIAVKTPAESVLPTINGRIGERVIGKKFTMFSGEARTLNLPVEDTPEFQDRGGEDWVSVAEFGAKPGGEDASTAVQRAVDSGKPVIYFPPGDYRLLHPVVLRGKVRRLVGFSSRFQDAKGKVLFRCENQEAPVSIENFRFFDGGQIEHAAPQPVVLKYCTGLERDGLVMTEKGSTWFFEDVCVSHLRLPSGKRLFARQWNNEPEPPGVGFTNDGGLVWALGMKSEFGNTIGVTQHGGRTEILGGMAVPAQGFKDPETPIFVCEDSALSFTWNEMTFGNPYYRYAVRETRAGTTKVLRHEDFFKGGTQVSWSLFWTDGR